MKKYSSFDVSLIVMQFFTLDEISGKVADEDFLLTKREIGMGEKVHSMRGRTKPPFFV